MLKKFSLIIWFGMLLAFGVFSCMSYVVHAQEENLWEASEWIGRYVLIQPVQRSERLATGNSFLTGEQMKFRYLFKTVDLIMKERNVQIALVGTPNPKGSFFVGDFDTHCTQNGTKLFLLLQQLKVPLGKKEYLAIRNAIAGWDFISIEWRDFFTFEEIEGRLKEAFIAAGFAPGEGVK